MTADLSQTDIDYYFESYEALRRTGIADDSAERLALAERLRLILRSDPTTAVRSLTTLLNSCRNQDEVGFVIAGPFEDFFRDTSFKGIEHYRRAAETDSRLLMALKGCYLGDDEFRSDPKKFDEWSLLRAAARQQDVSVCKE